MTTNPTSAERSVESVAAGLTKAQRRELMAAYETVFMGRMKLRGRNARLRDLGLATLAWRGGDLLTTLGEAVRAHLTASEKKG